MSVIWSVSPFYSVPLFVYVKSFMSLQSFKIILPIIECVSTLMSKCSNAPMHKWPNSKFLFLKIIIFDKYFMFFMLSANLTAPSHNIHMNVSWYFILNIWLIIPCNNSLVRWCILAMVQWCMDASVVCSLNLTP